MLEIERKYLVRPNSQWKKLHSGGTRIVQGYLSSVPERTVRVRIKGKRGYLTIKGKSSEDGLSRFEWEKEIPLGEAESLLLICEPGIIEKRRYEVLSGKHVVEIDEFLGENEGLLLAEVELSSEDEVFEIPKWLGKEVTGNVKYYNSYLSTHPYQSWKNLEK